MGVFTAPPITVKAFADAGRPELVFRGVEQAGPSFEGRVFLNRPDADQTTPTEPEAGYAGSFHVYGYGDHPPPALAEQAAGRGPGDAPVAPIEKQLRVDETTFRKAVADSGELTVTVVPVPADPGGPTPDRPFEGVDVVFGRG